LALFVVAFAISEEALLANQFTTYMREHNKQYATPEETLIRFQNFKATSERIKKLNSESLHAVFAHNKFSDMSQAEFRSQYLLEKMPADFVAEACLAKGVVKRSVESDVAPPDSIDWVKAGKVSPIKDQQQCGSCWTFSTSGAIESAYAIQQKQDASKLLLSEQAIVDCSLNCSNVDPYGPICNQGCSGGWPWAALTDVIRWQGLPTEDDYPYTATDGTCVLKGKKVFAPPKSYNCLSGPDQKGGPADEKVAMPTALAAGPLSIALNADMFQSYSSGIINPSDPSTCVNNQLDHAVLLVGMDTDSSVPYWLIKNSWGTSWGEQGYVRMFRGNGLCGVNAGVMQVVL
jgi:C1A family cysteine protease